MQDILNTQQQEVQETAITPEKKYDIRTLRSPDGSVEVRITPYGSQILSLVINKQDIIYPLATLHSISKDPRPEGNQFRPGETTKPGGSFPSFFREVIWVGGKLIELVTHGFFGAPWNRWRTYKAKSRADHISMTSGPAGTEGFFEEDEEYRLHRDVTVVSNGRVYIHNEITNVGENPVVTPDFVEHAYFSSNADAVILCADGQMRTAESFARTAPENGNDIDTRINSASLGTLGKVVFLSEGEKKHVVVVSATRHLQDGQEVPIEEFCLYRFRKEQDWTAVEPSMKDIPLQPGESVSMHVTIQVFSTLDEYLATVQ